MPHLGFDHSDGRRFNGLNSLQYKMYEATIIKYEVSDWPGKEMRYHADSLRILQQKWRHIISSLLNDMNEYVPSISSLRRHVRCRPGATFHFCYFSLHFNMPL